MQNSIYLRRSTLGGGFKPIVTWLFSSSAPAPAVIGLDMVLLIQLLHVVLGHHEIVLDLPFGFQWWRINRKSLIVNLYHIGLQTIILSHVHERIIVIVKCEPLLLRKTRFGFVRWCGHTLLLLLVQILTGLEFGFRWHILRIVIFIIVLRPLHV